ncbi:hypothetical protein EMPS_00801 [Entomortierella parvispora]|uniref:Uncharacterized protein n=1 Tax=Entomortierella parvispora TaxID=205924 RepID=A0A9P3LSB7_9FUNG|nr:hypothetical protein EMPS_00801 [Entomortierella parvispora]
MFATTNFHFLRISKTGVLPLNLFLSEEDLEWFNDYTFQEVLAVLKPLLLSRVQLYEDGHISKKASNFANNSSRAAGLGQEIDDGLEDAGVILGGPSDSHVEQALTSSSTTTGRRRTGGGDHERPRFAIRFGFRPSTRAERGGSVLAAEKNLGFQKVKAEVVEDEEHLPGASRRARTDLEIDDNDGVQIREEDESDDLRVSDFQPADDEEGDGIDLGEDAEYRENNRENDRGSKRQRGGAAASSRSKRGKAVAQEDVFPASQLDQKPTLQIGYAPLKLHPQTLYIVVHSLGSTSSPFAMAAPPAVSSSKSSTKGTSENSAKNKKAAAQPVQQPPKPSEDELDDDSLFPPGLDDFLASV